MFIGKHYLCTPWFQAYTSQQTCARICLSLITKYLLVQVKTFSTLLPQNTLIAPLSEDSSGTCIAIIECRICWLFLPQFKSNNIVRILRVIAGLGGLRNHIIGWSNYLRHVTYYLARISYTPQWLNICHTRNFTF